MQVGVKIGLIIVSGSVVRGLAGSGQSLLREGVVLFPWGDALLTGSLPDLGDKLERRT